ncbi:hypothetical protein D3C78_1454780 [compost metagenome]
MIAYPNATRPLDRPWDLGISNPSIVNPTIGNVIPNTTVTTPADIPVPANPPIVTPASPWTPTLPNTDWPNRLKVAVTTRFPFSLPWDVAYLVNLFVAPPQVPVINVDAGPIKFKVTLDKIDPYLPFLHAFIIAGFLWGLVHNTRRLLGGGQ